MEFCAVRTQEVREVTIRRSSECQSGNQLRPRDTSKHSKASEHRDDSLDPFVGAGTPIRKLIRGSK